jgi:hypothetical protein
LKDLRRERHHVEDFDEGGGLSVFASQNAASVSSLR